jgi:hypothetical protein
MRANRQGTAMTAAEAAARGDLVAMPFTYDDGGVCRAIAIATQIPYQDVYELIIKMAAAERPRGKTRRSHPRTGVHTPLIRKLMAGQGWAWTPAMGIGTGCTIHLADGELPPGRLLVNISRHITAVIDGVVHDTGDPGRDGTRCVYGWWYLPDRPTPTEQETTMRPSKGASRPSVLAINPRNRELSAARRVKLLAAFDSLDEDTRADLLELAEDFAFLAGDRRMERDDARQIIRQLYAAAGWEEEYHG